MYDEKIDMKKLGLLAQSRSTLGAVMQVCTMTFNYIYIYIYIYFYALPYIGLQLVCLSRRTLPFGRKSA